MGYYGGMIVSGRCEDFPCCGHTDGDPCPQPYEVKGTLEYALAETERKWHEEQRIQARRNEYERAFDTCEEFMEANPTAEVDYTWHMRSNQTNRILENWQHECANDWPTASEAVWLEGLLSHPEGYRNPPDAEKNPGGLGYRAVGGYVDLNCGQCKNCISEAYDNEAEWERERYERDNY